MEALDNSLASTADRQRTYPETWADLQGVEVPARPEGYPSTKTNLANLLFHRSLEQFDFAFQPYTDERQVREPANPDLLRRGHQGPALGTSRRGQD